MLKEILDSLKQASYDRVRNPFLAALTVSWVSVNWRLIALLLLGDDPVITRIEAIEEASTWVSGLWLPVAIAIGYVIVMPWITFGVDRIQAQARNRQKSSQYVDRIKGAKKRIEWAETEARAENAKERIQKQDELALQQQELELKCQEADLRDHAIYLKEVRELSSQVRRLQRVAKTARKRYRLVYSEATASWENLAANVERLATTLRADEPADDIIENEDLVRSLEKAFRVLGGDDGELVELKRQLLRISIPSKVRSDLMIAFGKAGNRDEVAHAVDRVRRIVGRSNLDQQKK